MTYEDVVNLWNAQADEWNKWPALCEEEKIEFTIRIVTELWTGPLRL